MEDTRLPKCVMFGEMVGGAGCVGGQEKEWMGCFLDDLRPFGINADQWTTAAQDEGNGAERQNKRRNVSWRNGSFQRKPRLDYACSGKPELDGKNQEEDIPEQAGSCWFARLC